MAGGTSDPPAPAAPDTPSTRDSPVPSVEIEAFVSGAVQAEEDVQE